MRNLWLLIKLNLDEEFHFSATHHEKNKKHRRILFLQRMIALACIAAIWFACSSLGKTMASHQLASAIPVFSYVLGSILTLIFTILKIIEILSGKEDTEYQMSLPIPTFFSVLCIFLKLYVWNTFVVLLTGTPMLIAYVQSKECPDGFIPLWILGALTTALPIIGIASLLGMFLSLAISSKKNSNQILSIITLVILTAVGIVILRLLSGMGSITLSLTASDSSLGTDFIEMICKNYKLGRFYQYGIVEQKGMWTFLFLLLSFIWNLFFVFFFTMAYQIVILALRAPHIFGEYHFAVQEQTALCKALFKKEWMQYTHSRSYMVSTLAGVVFALLFCIYGVILHPAFMTEWISDNRAVPFLLAACLGASNTTYCAFSMEGKRHWLTQTLPIDSKAIRKAKRNMNLCITLPSGLICAILLCAIYQPGLLWGVLYLLIPSGYAYFNAMYGLYIGEKFAEYNLASENQILRQSNAFFIGWIPGVVLPLLVAMCYLL